MNAALGGGNSKKDVKAKRTTCFLKHVKIQKRTILNITNSCKTNDHQCKTFVMQPIFNCAARKEEVSLHMEINKSKNPFYLGNKLYYGLSLGSL